MVEIGPQGTATGGPGPFTTVPIVWAISVAGILAVTPVRIRCVRPAALTATVHDR
jgi:hypothetical protein